MIIFLLGQQNNPFYSKWWFYYFKQFSKNSIFGAVEHSSFQSSWSNSCSIQNAHALDTILQNSYVYLFSCAAEKAEKTHFPIHLWVCYKECHHNCVHFNDEGFCKFTPFKTATYLLCPLYGGVASFYICTLHTTFLTQFW